MNFSLITAILPSLSEFDNMCLVLNFQYKIIPISNFQAKQNKQETKNKVKKLIH